MNTKAADSTKKTGPIRVLIIQLARLGDTLQTLMALRAAKQSYPELEIHMVVRENFAEAAKRARWIKSVTTLPTTDFLQPILDGTQTEDEMLPFLAQWARPLVQDRWDLLVNWSFSEPSSYLCGLIPAKAKLGYTRGRDLSLGCADDWSCFVQGIVQGDVHQNIHLTDIFTTQLLTALQIEFGEPTNPESDSQANRGFFTLELRPSDAQQFSQFYGKKWVGLQLGAGKDEKTWAPENFAALADKILIDHPDIHIVLLGGTEDRTREEKFLSAMKYSDTARLVSLVGKAKFDLWASVVTRCDSVIAGDTAVIHLASILGTRVLNLSLGPVKWAETGPYGNGHYILSPETGNGSDQKTVSMERVYAVWSFSTYSIGAHFQSGRAASLATHIEELKQSKDLRDVRVLRSRIRTPEDGGGVVYETLSHSPFQMQDWIAMVMGHLARAWYCGWVPQVAGELTRENLSAALLQQIRVLKDPAQKLHDTCEAGILIAHQIEERSKTLASDRLMEVGERDDLQKLSLELQDIERKIETIVSEHRVLKGFAQMNKVMLHNLLGERLKDMARETAQCFQRTTEGLKILQAWIEQTLKIARPQAVKSGNVISLASHLGNT